MATIDIGNRGLTHLPEQLFPGATIQSANLMYQSPSKDEFQTEKLQWKFLKIFYKKIGLGVRY